MGRKPKVHGKLYEGPRGKRARMAIFQSQLQKVVGLRPRWLY